MNQLTKVTIAAVDHLAIIIIITKTHMYMRKVLVSSCFLLIGYYAIGQVKFKNTGWSKLSVAICYYDVTNGWTTKGWYNIDPNEEKQVYNYNILSNPNFYYCAVIEKCDNGFFGDTYLLTDAKNSFTIANADKVQADGNNSLKKYGFKKIDLKGKSSYTVDLAPINLFCNSKRQGKWVFSLDKEGEYAEKKEDRVYYREITFDNGRPIGWCKDFYNDGTLKAEFKLAAFNPVAYDGKCTWYNKDGSIEKEALYKNGAIVNEKTTDSYGQAMVKQSQLKVMPLPVQKFYINSTSNETWRGGSSKTVLYVTLPQNTVEWYYEFTASRDEQVNKANEQQFSSAAKLASLIDRTGLVSGAISMLTAPPGGDICNVYVMNGNYSSLFIADGAYRYWPDVSRTNYKSGIVQVKNTKIENPIIGIKNNDLSQGIHVSIQIVAIVSVFE